MLPSKSVENPDFKKGRAWSEGSLHVGVPSPTPSRLLRIISPFKFVRKISRKWKKDRYFDTGESGETYDVEMEAASMES